MMLATPLAALPAAAQPANEQIDPARLASAKVTVDFIFPTGTYAKMMDGTLQSALGPIMDATGSMSVQQIALAAGVKPEDVSKLGKGTLADIMKILDPAYKQRMDATMGAMMPAMAKVMSDFEPGMREGLTRAYARHFDKTQLDDMNRFFATPSGAAYASNAMLIQLDPEVMTRMTEAMPKVLQGVLGAMPDIMKQVEAKTAGLPKPRKYADLTPAERTQLATLLGVPEKDLRKAAK
ncbi:MAG: DUF2059 domain-containing protein [Sphingobium sp.]|nr:DUF2059 domain-containing protein [Sphingobium sp.]